MDTKYWGPSGWKLLHLITFARGTNPSEEDRRDLHGFFTTLPYVLPCKYCRSSLTEYMAKNSLDSALENGTLAKWLWTIHNEVNGKLRGQRLHVEDNPSFSSVKKIYTERAAAPCTRTKFEGWEFLFSIVENHPFSRQALHGSGMPGADDLGADATTEERNRLYALKPEERLEQFQQFWKFLPRVLPYKEWRTTWEACETDWTSRASSLKTLWSIRCRMESALKLLNQTDYSSLCKELRTHRSGCNKSVRAKTCRKKRTPK
jgi:hypothetical protein